jgi:hypothetical protein
VLQVAVREASYVGLLREGQEEPVMLAITHGDFATFPGLAPGRYVVARFHSDHNVEPVPVGEGDVVAGRTTWLDLRSASARAVVRGRVLAGSRPAAGARVYLLSAVTQSAHTAEDGSFRLESGHLLRFRADDHSNRTLRVQFGGLARSYAPGNGDAVASLDAVLQLGEHTVAIELADADGAPARGALELYWQPAAPPDADASGATLPHAASGNVVVGSSGSVRIGPLPRGTLSGTLEFADGLLVPVTTAVPRAEVLRIVSRPRATVTVRMTRDGKPAPGARVYAATWTGEGPAPVRVEEFGRTTASLSAHANDDGIATLSVAAGEVAIWTDHVGSRAAQSRLRVDAGQCATLDIVLP